MCAGVLKDVLNPSDHIWFQERFQEAAVKRYGRLQAACNEAVGSGALNFASCHINLPGLWPHLLALPKLIGSEMPSSTTATRRQLATRLSAQVLCHPHHFIDTNCVLLKSYSVIENFVQ